MAKSLLESLGEKYRPSKRDHGYLPVYAQFLELRRFCVLKFCEIGVETDCSIRMWEEYFPNADEIIGVDINPECKRFERGRVKILTGDQRDVNFLNSLPTGFDVIVDDGSHKPEHMLLGMRTLIPRMSKNGVYVVEHTLNYHELVFEFYNTASRSVGWWGSNIAGIACYRYLTFLFKGMNPEEGEAHTRLKNPNFWRDITY